MVKNKLFLFINGLSVYVFWWTCFSGASVGRYYMGLLLAIIYFTFHFYVIENKIKEFKFMLFCISFGFIFESLFHYTGFMNYKGILPQEYSIISLWVLTLWVGYSLTAFHSFRWIYRRYYLSLFLGGLFAPLIYLSGSKIGCIVLKYNILISSNISFFMINQFSVIKLFFS